MRNVSHNQFAPPLVWKWNFLAYVFPGHWSSDIQKPPFLSNLLSWLTSSVVLGPPFHCCAWCCNVSCLHRYFKTQRLIGVPSFLWKCDLFCLPDNKVFLPNKTRSSWLQGRTMYILFHLKYKCSTASQSFTVGPGLSPCKQNENLWRGLDSCNSASFSRGSLIHFNFCNYSNNYWNEYFLEQTSWWIAKVLGASCCGKVHVQRRWRAFASFI